MSFPFLFASGDNLIAHALEEPKDQRAHWAIFEHGGIFHDGLSIPLPGFGQDIVISKFKILILLAAAIVFFLFNRLAKRISQNGRPEGRLDNLLESLLLMVRDQIARPNLGDKTEQFLPFLWTMFSMVLTINLIGMLPAPLFGCANACIAVTAAWAIFTLIFILINGIGTSGLVGWLKGFWIPIDVPVLGPVISALLFVIEFVGVFLRIGVLALRLFANMLGGHITLSLLITFILMAAKISLWHHVGIGVASLLGAYVLSFLELFVAFLQAFVFTILSAVFIGTAVHSHDHGHEEHGDHSHGSESGAAAAAHHS